MFRYLVEMISKIDCLDEIEIKEAKEMVDQCFAEHKINKKDYFTLYRILTIYEKWSDQLQINKTIV